MRDDLRAQSAAAEGKEALQTDEGHKHNKVTGRAGRADFAYLYPLPLINHLILVFLVCCPAWGSLMTADTLARHERRLHELEAQRAREVREMESELQAKTDAAHRRGPSAAQVSPRRREG